MLGQNVHVALVLHDNVTVHANFCSEQLTLKILT